MVFLEELFEREKEDFLGIKFIYKDLRILKASAAQRMTQLFFGLF